MDTHLTLGCVNFFDRTSPILEQQVTIEGFRLEPQALKPTELLDRFGEFDICEIPFFAYIALRALEDMEYTALPVFPHRGFPHGSAAVYGASGIKKPRDLIGRKIGTPNLFLSGTVWMRGILEEQFGVDGKQVRWVTLPTPPASPMTRIAERAVKRSGIDVHMAAQGINLSSMLERGEIDAWIGPLPPECLERGAAGIVRLFPDYREVERSYARTRRFIPALHTVVMRRRLHNDMPELATRIVELFDRARDVGLKNFRNDNVFAIMLPWMRHHLDEAKEIFGADCLPTGLIANREMIAAGLRYANRQGLTNTESISELFAS